MNDMPKCLIKQYVVKAGVIAFALVFGGCSVTSGLSVSDVRVRNVTGVTTESAQWGVDQSRLGQLGGAYYDKDRVLRDFSLSGNNGPEGGLSLLHNKERASSGVKYVMTDSGGWVGFRDKYPERDLFFRAPDGKVFGLGAESIPLARFDAFQIDRDRIGVVWYGEPGKISEDLYYVFYREIDGKTGELGELNRLFKGIYPVAVQTSDKRIFAFSWIFESGKGRIVARVKSESGQFGGEIKIADVDSITRNFKAVAVGGRAIVFWHAQYGELRNQYKLEGAYSDDGANWTRFEIAELSEWDIQSLDVATDGSRRVALTVGALPHEEWLKKGKMKVRLFLSPDGGETWSGAVNPVFAGAAGEFPQYFHAQSPKVALDQKGGVYLVWQDWRNIRSGIRFSYSQDFGKNWVISDRLIVGGDSLNYALHLDEKSIFLSDGRVRVFAEKYVDDGYDEKQVALVEFNVDSLMGAKFSKESAAAAKQDRLRKRVLDYFRALENKDYQKAYTYFDPFFRSKVTQENYQKMVGRLEYSGSVVKDLSVLGSIGSVIVTSSVEVKPIRIDNRVLKLDKVERDIPTRWVFIDGDWYNEFSIDSQGVRFTKF